MENSSWAQPGPAAHRWALFYQCVVRMGVQGTVTALQTSCLWAPSLSQIQPREEKMLISTFIRKSTEYLQMFNALQLGFVSCVVLAQGFYKETWF